MRCGKNNIFKHYFQGNWWGQSKEAFWAGLGWAALGWVVGCLEAIWDFFFGLRSYCLHRGARSAAGADSRFRVVQSWGAGGLSFSVCSCSPCFCWAYVQLLLRCGTSLHDCQKVVAYPLLLARAVGVECSTSLPGGNQVDGLPPAPVGTFRSKF